MSGGAPANGGHLVAELHHGRPNVIEELNFGNWFEAANGHADGAADDIRFGQGRIKNALGAKFPLQAGGGFEDAALPFYRRQAFFAAAIGDVFAENDDALVAFHFIEQSEGDHFDHGFRMAFFFRGGIEIAGGRVYVRRVDPFVNRIRCREFGRESAIGGSDNLAVHFGFQGFDFAFFQDAFAHQEHGEFRKRVALRFGGAFGLALVELFIVGKRVRIGPDYVRVDQRGAFAGAAMFGGAAQRGIAFQRLGAVAFFDVQIRIISYQFGNAATGSLDFYRNGNGVTVVFD